MDQAARIPADLSVGQCATLACLLEVIATKPGNVHRAADFEDLGLLDFAVSSAAIEPAIALAHQQGVGAAVLQATRATQDLVQSNTNLGTILLLAPLAAVSAEMPLVEGLPGVLANLQPADAAAVYEAIRLASPGGLGKVDEMDVAGASPPDLLTAMRHAADHDLVARQYTNGFEQVFGLVAPRIVEGCQCGLSLTTAVIDAHIFLMAQHPDSLIARKCGQAVAVASSERAARVIAAGQPNSDAYSRAASDLDFWLRSDGHRRNPGTSADLIAAALFVALRERWVTPPFR
ncbi:MAG: triphosphoribosyl-dephospho-CoA synthase [Pirellulaceae bacterium]|nr:triphosphoribosyl-dephospho-CoA synthase [Pirellulaceae bacterium]